MEDTAIHPTHAVSAETFSPQWVAAMHRMEGSLESSSQAVLALDLAGMERETREQTAMIRAFEGLVRSAAQVPSSGPPASKKIEIEESRKRILQLVRLQSALLARAQGKLRVLANMLAGPSITYGPFLTPNPGAGLSGSTQAGVEPCRA